MAMSQEECCKTVRSSVRVKEVKTNIRWRDELRHQPGPMDHQTQQEIGVPATESEEDRATATLCLSLDAIRAGVETTIHVAESPGSARRGRYINPASSTANVQGRKAQTDVPVREKLRSQPGREDHQAYRYSKGSEATESEEDRANATLCLSPEAIGATDETTSHVVDRV